MAITATHVSSSSFTVATDRTADFVPGRALYCDCGTDGIKIAYVSYSSYSAPDTTVNLESAESQALTANLESVLFSTFSVKESAGNAPLQTVWTNRGFKSGLSVSYKDADEIYIDSGALHIDNGSSENIYCAQSQLTKQLTSLSASTWYAIYVDPPDSGLTLAAADIEYSATMPGYDQAKRGWYHGANTDWRCIGFVYANASSNIAPFCVDGEEWLATDAYLSSPVENATPSSTWTSYTMNVPIGGFTAIVLVIGIRANADGTLMVRPTGLSGGGLAVLAVLSASARHDLIQHWQTGSSKQVDLKWYASTTNAIYVNARGFLVPKGM